MSKIFGGKKGFFLKALSIGLSALTLSQFSVGAVPPKTASGKPVAHSKTRRGRKPRQPRRVKSVKPQPSVVSRVKKVTKEHPIAVGAGVAALLTSPIWGPRLLKHARRCARVNIPKPNIRSVSKPEHVEVRNRIRALELDWSNNEGRIMDLNNGLNIWLGFEDSSAADLAAIIANLSKLILESGYDANDREIGHILSQVNLLLMAARREMENIQNQELREQMSTMCERLIAVRNRLHNLSDSGLNVPQHLWFSDLSRQFYARNIITQIDVGNVDTEGSAEYNAIKEKLRILCERFNVSGISQEDNVGNRSYSERLGRDAGWWEMSPYEYYFDPFWGGPEAKFIGNPGGSTITEGLNHDRKVRFSQMITLMYEHRDDPAWREVIVPCLNELAMHGGHCSWRAAAMCDQAFQMFKGLIDEHNLDPNAGDADEEILLFSAMKDEVLKNAKGEFLREHANDREPLNDWNQVASVMESWLGIGTTYIREGASATQTAVRLFNRIASKQGLISIADRILHDKLHSTDALNGLDRGLFSEIIGIRMSFMDYCRMVGKTQDDIRSLLAAIERSEDGDLLEWSYGTRNLTLEEIYRALAYAGITSSGDGCPEYEHWYGVKFLALLNGRGFIEERA